jgi:hypothetical protein
VTWLSGTVDHADVSVVGLVRRGICTSLGERDAVGFEMGHEACCHVS